MTPALLGLLALGCCAVALVGVTMVRGGTVGVAADHPGGTRRQRSPIASVRTAIGRATAPLVRRGLSDRARARLDHWLDAAGRPNRKTIDDVVHQKGADVVICSLLGIGVLQLVAPIAPLLPVYGWFREDLALRSAAKARQTRIDRDLPDFLDILVVTVQAGLKFRGALRRVGEQFQSPVTEEFRIALQQMDVGASRRDAFEGVRARNDSAALNRFVGALLIAEELGAPLSDAMLAISRDMRKSFSQDVRKRASEAAPKVTLVATVFLMPAAALLLIGGLLIGGQVDFGGVFDG